MTTPSESGFRILNVLILESSFKREPVIDFQVPLENSFDLNVNSEKVGETNQFVVQVKVILKGLQKEKPEFSVEVTMAALFEKFGEPDFSDEQFLNVNAPAIIFLFIREHISSLGFRAMSGPKALASC